MSNVNSPIYEQDIKRTPTPGGDYNSLLNDSSTNRYITEDFDKIREYSSIDLSEDNTNSLQKLKADNEFLKVQVEIANKEKEMHIQLNAQEKIKTCKQIKHLKLKLQTELLKLKKENETLLETNKLLSAKLQKVKIAKKENEEYYKKQTESQENHYQLLLNEKDRIINTLKSEKKTKTIKKSVSKKKPFHTKKSSIPLSLLSPKAATPQYIFSPKQELDKISQLIVKLEKEQAELKEAASDPEYSAQFSYQKFPKNPAQLIGHLPAKNMTQQRIFSKNRQTSEY